MPAIDICRYSIDKNPIPMKQIIPLLFDKLYFVAIKILILFQFSPYTSRSHPSSSNSLSLKVILVV